MDKRRVSKLISYLLPGTNYRVQCHPLLPKVPQAASDFKIRRKHVVH